MSKKTELIKIFKEYKTKYEGIQAQITEINKSVSYTPAYREETVARLLDGFTPTIELYRNKAVEIINNGLDDLAEKWKNSSAGRLTDSGYQAGLANVVKMLELKAVREKEDIQNIIDTYAGDYNALAVIKKILLNSSDETLALYAFLIPEDNRERNKQLLNQLKGNVERYISTKALRDTSKTWNTFNQGLTGVSSSMDSMAEFVTNKLGDDLELL